MKTTLLTFISAAALTCAISTYALNHGIKVTHFIKADGTMLSCKTGSCERIIDDTNGNFKCICDTKYKKDTITIYFDME